MKIKLMVGTTMAISRPYEEINRNVYVPRVENEVELDLKLDPRVKSMKINDLRGFFVEDLCEKYYKEKYNLVKIVGYNLGNPGIDSRITYLLGDSFDPNPLTGKSYYDPSPLPRNKQQELSSLFHDIKEKFDYRGLPDYFVYSKEQPGEIFFVECKQSSTYFLKPEQKEVFKMIKSAGFTVKMFLSNIIFSSEEKISCQNTKVCDFVE